MFVFGIPVGSIGMKWHLHCGDFRANPSILNQKLIYHEGEEYFQGNVLHFTDFLFDSVYLDTTYAHPKHCFPPQDQVIGACVQGCSRLLNGNYDLAGQKRLVPLKWLIAVGSYLIGKERIILGIAETLNLLIYADARKRSILKLLKWPELEDRLTADPRATPLHLVSMALLSKQKLTDYRDSFQDRFTHVLGIRPTGWTFTNDPSKIESSNHLNDYNNWNLEMPRIDGNVGVWPVPYSEHSSYRELEHFLNSISVHRVIPTVDNYADIVLDSRRVGGNTKSLLSQWAHRKSK